jgi:hypothetical protein
MSRLLLPSAFAIRQPGERAVTFRPTADRRPAHGVHDVVIEAADHVRSILAVDPAHWRDVWELCRQRLAALADRSDLAWATVFKNSGPRAGASLEHLHSQLIALDFVPPVIEAPPVNELLPPSVRVPSLDLVRPAAPARLALIVVLPVAEIAMADSAEVVTLRVLEPLIVTSGLEMVSVLSV